MTQRMYRQGDVFLVACDEPEKGTTLAVEREKREGHANEKVIVLAHGERTGHAHVLDAAPDAAQLRRDRTASAAGLDGRRFLHVIEGGLELTHDEHDAIELPPGWYEVRRQREYTPERTV